MSSFYDDASLVVIPSGYKTSKVYAEKPTDGSGDLAFTRTGDTATRVNSAGIIEKVRTNLALNSEGNVSTYNTAINVSNAASSFSSFANAIQIPSTGTSVAYKSVVTTAQPYSISVYIKMDDNSVPVLSSSTTSGNVSLIIAGSFATDNLKVESVGNNVYRLSGSATGSGASNNNGVVRYDTQTLKSFKIAGIQLEVGDVATAYIKTTSAAVSVGPVANVPRLDYTGSTCPRLLLEPQRTNLVTYSEQFNNAAWLKINTTATANVIASPDGYTNADKIIPANGNNIAVVYQSIVPSGTSTASVYAKAGEFGGIVIATGTTGAFFNLTTGQYRTAYNAAPTAYSITSVGNGWYRCSVTFTSAADNLYIGANDNVSNDLTVTGNGTSGIYVWGAQLEGSNSGYPTSYIPTLAATATRGADSCSKTGISSLIGQTEGTLFAQVPLEYLNFATYRGIISVSDGTFDNGVFIFVDNDSANSNQFAAYIRNNGGNEARILGSNLTTANIGSTYKIAMAYKANDFVFYINGVQIGSDTSGAIAGTLSRFDLGSIGYTGISPTDRQSVSQSLVFKTRLTNAQLAELTTL